MLDCFLILIFIIKLFLINVGRKSCCVLLLSFEFRVCLFIVIEFKDNRVRDFELIINEMLIW